MSFLRGLQKRYQNIEKKENNRHDEQDVNLTVTGKGHTKELCRGK